MRNFLVKKTKKLEEELSQVRAQLERTSSAKLDEMLNSQKSASDQKIGRASCRERVCYAV